MGNGGIEQFSFECQKVIGFASTMLFKKLPPLLLSYEKRYQSQHHSFIHVFLCFASATCNYFEFYLVHWILFVVVITLVLVLQHSDENCSKSTCKQIEIKIYEIQVKKPCQLENLTHFNHNDLYYYRMSWEKVNNKMETIIEKIIV